VDKLVENLSVSERHPTLLPTKMTNRSPVHKSAPDCEAENCIRPLPALVDRRAAHALVEKIYDEHHKTVPEIDRSQPVTQVDLADLM
jgi:hypothetical protein